MFLAGLVSSVAPSLISSVLGGNNPISSLLQQSPLSAIQGAASNILGNPIADLIKDVINNAPLPDFIKDAANDAIDSAIADAHQAIEADVETDTESAMESFVEQLLELVQDFLTEAASEADAAAGEGGAGEGGAGEAGGKGGGNWLAVLARAMGDVAGQHLARSVELGQEISSMSSGGDQSEVAANAQEMAGLQAEMQAETQMFKLAQEATATIIKSVGEALSSTARKQ